MRGVLGRGGMATVYRAFDLKHQRDVAVKVLRPEVAASLGAERFLAEIQTVARLTHPHILPLHDSGESEGFVYYVAPLIEGGSLRQRLEQVSHCDLEQTIEIASRIADALSYAHRMGVVHRDIKPENILFSQGHPVVADFGIAKALSSASGRNLTRTGVSLGTPGYMSPEQAAGFHELDARTDVFSLAVVVYEMLIGEIPGCWPSEAAVRARTFTDVKPGHRLRLNALGSTLEAALVHAMAIRREDRTPTPEALMDELRGRATATPRRRYQADEVDEIIKRASELEVSNPTQSGAMTIGGVEAIAAEVGIAPGLVRSAAASVAPSQTSAALLIEPPKRNGFIGGPTRLLVQRVIPGELRESDFPRLVDEIRRAFQNVGYVSQLGRSMTWSMSRGSAGRRDVDVAIIVGDGNTRVVVEEGLAQMIGGIFGGLGGGLGGGGIGPVVGTVMALHAPVALPIVLPIWFIGVFGLARTSFQRLARRRERALEQAADRLATTAAHLIEDRSG
jgi:serine/threonine protein kinase